MYGERRVSQPRRLCRLIWEYSDINSIMRYVIGHGISFIRDTEGMERI